MSIWNGISGVMHINYSNTYEAEGDELGAIKHIFNERG